MAYDTFTWCTQYQGSGGQMASDDNTRSVTFGNGYTQVASAGFNNFRRSFTIVYGNTNWKEVYDFLVAHRIKPFIWKTPDGDLGLFRVQESTIASKIISSDIRELSCTFIEQFTAENI